VPSWSPGCAPSPLALVSLGGSLTLLVLTVLSLVLVPLGVGLVTTPWVLTGVRAQADRRRLLAAQWCAMLSASPSPTALAKSYETPQAGHRGPRRPTHVDPAVRWRAFAKQLRRIPLGRRSGRSAGARGP